MEHHKKFLIIGNKNSITYKEFFPLLKDNQVWIGYNSPSEFNTPTGLTKKVSGLGRWFTNLDIAKRHEKLILYKQYTPEEYPKYDNYDAINVDKVSDIPMDYCESWGVTNEEYKQLNADEWEITRTANDLHFIIPTSGTTLREDLDLHADGYKEHIEKALMSQISKKDLTNGVNKKDALTDRYCNGIIGVPITFLDKYNPGQFRIIGLDRYTIPAKLLIGERGSINGKPTYARIFVSKTL